MKKILTLFFVLSLGITTATAQETSKKAKKAKASGETLSKVKPISTIKEMEKRLEGKPFFRCNSGLIVNLAKVQSVRNNEIQIHGETLTVSRSRKKEFMELLTEYMGEGEYV